MSESSTPESDGGLPASFYEQLRTPLILVHIVCHHVFQHPATALTRETAALTGLDAAFVHTMNSVHDNNTLAAVMLGQPERFWWYLQLGYQLLTSPLGPQLAERIQPKQPRPPLADAEPAETTQLLEHFVQGLRILTDNFATYLSQRSDALSSSPELGALQLEGIVARQLSTLPPLPQVVTAAEPLVEQHEEDHDEPTDEDNLAARLQFQEGQLQVMRLAVTLPQVLPGTLDTPFTQGIGALPAFRQPLLGQLRKRLLAAQPDVPLGFTLPELALLYRGVQVCAMAMLQPEIEGEFMQGLDPANASPESASQVRHVLTIIVAGFVELMHREYGTEPELAQAQQEIAALADLL